MFMQSETSNLTLKFRGYLWEKGNIKETSFSYSTLNICVFTIRQYWSLIERIAISKEPSTFKGKRVHLHKIYVYLTFYNTLICFYLCVAKWVGCTITTTLLVTGVHWLYWLHSPAFINRCFVLFCVVLF